MFADGFEDTSRMNLTSCGGYIYDSRQLVCQSRSQSSAYLLGAFETIGAWTTIHNGTGSVDITTGTGPTGGGAHVVQLSTGYQVGSQAGIQRYLSTIPESYGVMLLSALISVSTNVADAQETVIQNTVNNKRLHLFNYSGGIYVKNSAGTLVCLSTHAPSFFCEWWIENKANSNGTNTVSIYGGTEFMCSATLELPVGPTTNSGLVLQMQNSGANGCQVSQLMNLNIGNTQLPDDAVIVGLPYVLPRKAIAANVSFFVEDVCNAITMNTDFTADLQLSGAWERLTLVDKGSWYKGKIDNSKSVREFVASFPCTIEQGSQIAYKAHLLNGKFQALLHAAIDFTSDDGPPPP